MATILGDGADVLVVGAGPVGLTMACELHRRGVSCRIIDDELGPTPPHESRALGIQARTLETFEKIGLVDPLLERGRKVHALNAYDGGRRFARLELDFDALSTPYPFILILPQAETERRLINVLEGLGGAVEWRTRLEALRQDDQGVTATLSAVDGSSREIRAAWLVGCDGAHSTVRHQLGLSFEGASYEEKFLLADVRLSGGFTQDEFHMILNPSGSVPTFPLPEPGHWRLIDVAGVVETDDPATITARFGELLHQAGLTAATIEETLWTSAFRISRRVVDHLRVGRCFLAGDAAHIHSPVGGQGMNTGIQDAYNLAWKLALVIHSGAPESLLDSYEAERLPVALAVLRGTDWATRVVTRIIALRNPVGRAFRNRLVAWLSRLGSVRRRLARELSELGVSYRGSPIVAEDGPPGPNALRAGDRVPDVRLAGADGPRRLFEVLRDPRHTLLLFDDSPQIAEGSDRREAVSDLSRRRFESQIVAYLVHRGPRPTRLRWEGSWLHDPDGELHRRLGDHRYGAGDCLSLIHPDGYIGYRARPVDPDKLDAYLTRLLVRS